MAKEKSQKLSGPVLSQNARLVEVILFLENEPVDKERLERMTGLSAAELKDAVNELADHYNHFFSWTYRQRKSGRISAFPFQRLVRQVKIELWEEGGTQAFQSRNGDALHRCVQPTGYQEGDRQHQGSGKRHYCQATPRTGIYKGHRAKGCDRASVSVRNDQKIPV